MNALNQLRLAAFLLFDRPGLPSLDDAAEAFGWIWASLAFADRWPPVMRAEAAGLIVAMLRHGRPQYTARVMTDRELQEFLTDFRRFLADAEDFMAADCSQQADDRPFPKNQHRRVSRTVRGQPVSEWEKDAGR